MGQRTIISSPASSGATGVSRLTILASGWAPAYPRVLDELVPAACPVMEKYANNSMEADHGRLKSRLRPMRELHSALQSQRLILPGQHQRLPRQIRRP
jgi:hypothetical protein